MNRTKRIQNILEKYFDDHIIIVKDNSYLHKGHNNFDGNNQTHILVQIKKNSKIELNRFEIRALISINFCFLMNRLEDKMFS